MYNYCGGNICSVAPISDTTLLTCSTLNINTIDHTKTQLPYTLAAAGLAAALYFVFGLLL